MKRVYLISACVVFLYFASAGQQTNTKKFNETKYRIDLPDFWGKGNKAWKVLTEKLPVICEELQDKDLCGDDCSPKYTVRLYITGPEITGYSLYKVKQNASTETRHLVRSLPNTSFVSPTLQPQAPTGYPLNNGPQMETFTIASDYQFSCYLLLLDEKESVITKMILVDTNEVWHSDYRGKDRNISVQNSDAFFEKNKGQMTPDKNELFAIVDKKILAL